MGRPLFSAAYDSAPAVAVRTEPEVVPSANPYEKWSRWGSFDPDSDELFESDEAVYEAFLDAADLVQRGADTTDGPETIGVLVEREMERAYSPVESLSSDSTVSGRESPMAEGPDDPAAMVADAYYAPTRPMQTARRINPRTWTSGTIQFPQSGATPDSSSTILVDLINERRISRNTLHATPRTFIPPRPSTQNDATPASSSSDESLVAELASVESPTPSPAQVITPRMFSWNAYQATRGIPDSPTPAQRYRDSPLTHASARISIPHISPAPVRIPIRTA